jgi:hypothetical protein
VRAPDKCTRLPVGLCRHAAGIHDDHVSLLRLLRAVPRRRETASDRLAIGPRRAASKVLHVKGTLHKTIVDSHYRMEYYRAAPLCGSRDFSSSSPVVSGIPLVPAPCKPEAPAS